MSWFVPRPASLKLTVKEPLLLSEPLAHTKCSFCATAAPDISPTKAIAVTAVARILVRIRFPFRREGTLPSDFQPKPNDRLREAIRPTKVEKEGNGVPGDRRPRVRSAFRA